MRPLREIEADIANCLKEIHEARAISGLAGLPAAEYQAAEATLEAARSKYWKLLKERNAAIESEMERLTAGQRIDRTEPPRKTLTELLWPIVPPMLVIVVIALIAKRNANVRLIVRVLACVAFALLFFGSRLATSRAIWSFIESWLYQK